MTKHTIERDTVRPETPIVSVTKTGDILGELLKISVKGERNTTAVIKVDTSKGKNYQLTGKLNEIGNYFDNDLIGKLVCGGVRYTISVSLIDKAGNVSFTSNISSLSTSECPVCGESSGLFTKPIHNDNAYIAYVYGYSQKYFSGEKHHSGVDYNGVSKGEPIYASAFGKVVDTRGSVTCENCKEWGYGNYVKVDHGEGVVSVYAHLQTVKVEKGDIVGTNTPLGTMGSSGYSTGPHLHFGVVKNGIHQNPENYLGKSSTNLNDSQFAAYCKKGGTGDESKSLVGTKENPWGEMTGADLGKIEIGVNVGKNYLFGGPTQQNNPYTINTVDSYVINVPAPRITFIEVNEKHTEAKVYGVAISKNANAEFHVYYRDMTKKSDGISGFCNLQNNWEGCLDTVKYSKYSDTIDNAGLSLYKERKMLNDNEIGFIWNDQDKGQWSYTMDITKQSNVWNLWANPKVGDTIYSKSKLWGDTKVRGIDGLSDIRYTTDNDPIISGESNRERIRDVTAKNLIEEISKKYSINIVEDGAYWTENEIRNLERAFILLPSSFYNIDNMTVKKQHSSSLFSQNGCTVNDDSYVAGYVNSNDTFHMCEELDSHGENDTTYQGIVIHELTHIFQRNNILNGQNKYSKGVIDEKDGKLYKYYDLLFNADSDYWSPDMNIFKESVIPTNCSEYGDGLMMLQLNNPYFLSTYQCTTSFRIKESGYPHYMPEEEMAESVKVFILNDTLLKNQDVYSVYVEDVEYKGNLGRYGYIKNYIIK